MIGWSFMTGPFLVAAGLSILSVAVVLTVILKHSDRNGRIILIMLIWGVVLPLVVLALPIRTELKTILIAGGIAMCALIRPLLENPKGD